MAHARSMIDIEQLDLSDAFTLPTIDSSITEIPWIQP